MIMGTIKPYNIDEKRIEASQHIHALCKGAIVIVIKYKDTFAEGYCQYRDGAIVSFEMWYRDMQPRVNNYAGRSEQALAYIHSIA